jgi:tetratricopeptide (TPR) repeat protein
MKADRYYPKTGIMLLPVLIALLLHLSPLPLGFSNSLHQARQAGESQLPEIQAQNLETAAKFFPKQGKLWEQAGLSYQQAGKFSDAIRCFYQAIDTGSLSESGWLALGDVQLKNEDVNGALDTWTKMLKSGVLKGEVSSRLLHFYMSQGNTQAALDIFNAWKDWGQESAEDIFHLGLSLSVTDSDVALPLLSQAGRLDANLGPSVRIIQAGINASSSSDPQSYRLLLIGRGLGSLGEWKLAENAFTQACQLSPDYAEAWAYLSQAQDQLGKDGQAALNKAIALKPDSVLIQAFQALYWEHHGKADLALVYLKAIAEQEPYNGMWQVEIGNALVQMGDLASALPYYQQAVTIEPGNPGFWRDLALFSLIYNVQLTPVGLPAARQAVVLDPANAVGLDILGQYFLTGQDLLSAERMFLNAISQDPQNAFAQFHLGLTYLEEGKRQPAYQTLTLAANLATGQPLAEQVQRVINQNFP